MYIEQTVFPFSQNKNNSHTKSSINTQLCAGADGARGDGGEFHVVRGALPQRGVLYRILRDRAGGAFHLDVFAWFIISLLCAVFVFSDFYLFISSDPA